MVRNNPKFLILLILVAGTLACSLSGVRQQVRSVEQTAQAVRSEMGGVISAGESIITTAQALETQHPGIIETAKALVTQGVPVISTMQAIVTNNPGLVETAQALINQELPSGEPPSDIPIIDRGQAGNFFSSSQYIIYSTQLDYPQVLEFYKAEMPNNGWQYQDSDSHEYANAAQLNYYKDNRIAAINLSKNPLNNTTIVVINLSTP